MNNKLSNLTVNILTYKTNREILNNCIDSISNEVTINIIENSKKFENEEYIKNKKKILILSALEVILVMLLDITLEFQK